MEKSPVGTSTDAAVLDDCQDLFHCLRPEVVAAVADLEDTPDSAVATAGQA